MTGAHAKPRSSAQLARELARARHAEAIEKRLREQDEEAAKSNAKMHVHVTCLTLSIIVTLALSFENSGLIIHCSGLLANTPILAYEIHDWIKKL